MPFVVDASITAVWAFDNEDHPHADVAFERLQAEEAIVPSLWWYEIRNVLVVNERRGRITQAATASFLHDLSELPVTIDREPDEAAIFALARQYRLTFYDAAYLELARRAAAPLATLDRALMAGARAERIPLLGNV